MAVLVTRPDPDNKITAEALQARGFEVLQAPMLRFEAVALRDDAGPHYAGIIVTSANALRGLASQPSGSPLLALPLFAVGEHTASAARDAGFQNVMAANSSAASLRDLVLECIRARTIKKNSTLLYLAGADLARDLAGELGERGLTVVTQTTYRMAPIVSLPREVCEAFAAGRVNAVLHYSRRSARAFLDAVRAAGVEISALAIPQCCLSDAVAAIVRDAGATQVATARSADENALFDVLERALRPGSR